MAVAGINVLKVVLRRLALEEEATCDYFSYIVDIFFVQLYGALIRGICYELVILPSLLLGAFLFRGQCENEAKRSWRIGVIWL